MSSRPLGLIAQLTQRRIMATLVNQGSTALAVNAHTAAHGIRLTMIRLEAAGSGVVLLARR